MSRTRILVPVDQSKRDAIARPYCVRMAQALQAEVFVLSVIPLARSFIPSSVRQVEAYVAGVAQGLSDEGIPATGIVRRGDIASTIVAVAQEYDVDLILMITRGRRGLGRLVLGSTAEAVLTNTQKPVLLLSEAGNGFHANKERHLQSVYLATVLWHKEAKGEITPEQARAEIERLAHLGLDRDVLLTTYERRDASAASLAWLDIDFQLRTLQTYLPEAVASFQEQVAREANPTREVA